jgi:hypothetical protein
MGLNFQGTGMHGLLGRYQTWPSAAAKSFAGGSKTAQIACISLDTRFLFKLRLTSRKVIASVNDTAEKWATRGAIDQLGHLLKCIIHSFAEADDDAKILITKWDIKDGFWQLNCQQGEE